MAEEALFILIVLSLAIRSSPFQTWLAHRVSDYLTEELGTQVKIDKVAIDFLNELELEGVYLEDVRKDTLLCVERIHATVDDWSIGDPFVDVSQLTLTGGDCYLRVYAGDSTFNFQQLVDYFASDQEEDTTSSALKLTVQKVDLQDVHFIYQDENQPLVIRGLDMSYLDIAHFSGKFSEIEWGGDELHLRLDGLQFEDRSGLKLTQLSTDLHYDDQLIGLSNLRIHLNNSQLVAKRLHFKTPNGSADWSDFLHRVIFDADLSGSRIATSDLAYFVPSLWGLETIVHIRRAELLGPICGMQINQLDMRLLDTTTLKGNLVIPDFDQLEQVTFREDIQLLRTSVKDIQQIDLRALLGDEGAQSLNRTLLQIQKAGVIQLTSASFEGNTRHFTVNAKLYSGIGNVHLNGGLQFDYDGRQQSYAYRGRQNAAEKGAIAIERLDVGTILGTDGLGEVNGQLNIHGKGFDSEQLDVHFSGLFDQFHLNGYDYSGIHIREGHFKQNQLKTTIDIEDTHLGLHYDGVIDLNDDMHFDFQAKLDRAHLEHLMGSQQTLDQNLTAAISADIHGTDVNALYGQLSINDLAYRDTERAFEMDAMTLNVSRGAEADAILIRSPYVDVDLTGKYDLSDLSHAVTEQLNYVIGNAVPDQHDHDADHEYYRLDVRFKDLHPVLALYDPDIEVHAETALHSEFDHDTKQLKVDLHSPAIRYHDIQLEDIQIGNHFDSTQARLNYQVQAVQLSDSFAVRSVYLDAHVQDNAIATLIGWDGTGTLRPALIAFQTTVHSPTHLHALFHPSFFHLGEHRYTIDPRSELVWKDADILFSNVNIANGEHYVRLEGAISENPQSQLQLAVHEFELADLNNLLGADLSLEGVLNAHGKLGDVYHRLKMEVQSKADRLRINDKLVGTVQANGKWDDAKQTVLLSGGIRPDSVEQLTFSGHYAPSAAKDNIAVRLDFAKMDIGFLNAFADPELYTEIAGVLDGQLQLSGEANNPVIKGELAIASAKVFVPMFNVFFGISGNMVLDKGAIVAENLKLIDQKGNDALANLQVYHDNWADWNYNVSIDMDHPSMKSPFLAMNTSYKEGDYYHGTAYVNGFVDLSGDVNHTEIEVDLKTAKGTDLVLPMYGSADLEENNFIVFDSLFFLADSLKNKQLKEKVNRVERLGMTLTMNFHVTPAAQVRVVFNPLTEDQIIARGKADIALKIDDFGDMSMMGKYVVEEGTYEMRLTELIDRDFLLAKGGIVEWTGSPYDALINLQAQFTSYVSLEAIVPSQEESRSEKEEIIGTLQMTNTLMKPKLTYAISSPTADDMGQKALNNINGDEKERIKQFFSLLLFKQFMYKGGGGGGESVALELAETQINSILSGLSDKYDLKAGLSDGQTTLGFETQLNDRLTISTSFGVLNLKDGEGVGAGNMVGDIDIEYRLNEDGTFTMNFFNETNNTVENHFTQGISLHYLESFNTTKELKLWQRFANVFRRRDKKVQFKKEKKSDRWTPVPQGRDTLSTIGSN